MWPDAQAVVILPGLVDLRIQREGGEWEEWRVNSSLIIKAIEDAFDRGSSINIYTGEQKISSLSSLSNIAPSLGNLD